MISTRRRPPPTRSQSPPTLPVPQDAHRTIPFDYAFRYELAGRPGNVLNDTVEISIESTFVGVSIGYGVIPRVTPVVFGVGLFPPGEFPPPRDNVLDVSLGEIADAVGASLAQTDRRLRDDTSVGVAFRNGIKLNPRTADAALASLERGGPIDAKLLAQAFQVVSPPAEDIQFLYALFDEGSGREFQSEPILNTAGLGISNGDRPFRHFPKPITFAPRAIIRLQITEVSDFPGDLHVTLQGYKVLGQAGSPTSSTRPRGRRR
jgi:hypothetical protein